METKLSVRTCCALSVFLRWLTRGSHSLFSHAGIKGLQTAKGYLASLFSPTAFLSLLISKLDLWLGRIEAKITCISA